MVMKKRVIRLPGANDAQKNITKNDDAGPVKKNQARWKVLKSLKLEKQYNFRQKGRNSVNEQVYASLVSTTWYC